MRLLALILSIYVLILSVIPCPDIPEDHTASNIEQTQQAQQSTGSHAEHTDHCSPFCTCSCCYIPAIVLCQAIQFKDFSLLQENYSLYKPSYSSFIQTSIWQPPQMS